MYEVIQVRGVEAFSRYGQPVLHDVSMTVRRGECMRVLGDKDSGKSTLARLIGGMERPAAGEVTVLGRRMSALEEQTAAVFRNKYIGYVSAKPVLWDGFTVAENAAMPLAVQGASREYREVSAERMLEMAGLGYAAHVYPQSLSPGEARIAALARALVAQPEILILEDALEGLDENYARRFIETVELCREEESLTLLSFTETEDDGMESDRTVRLKRGRIQGEKR